VEQHLAEREQRRGRHRFGVELGRVAIQRLIAPRQERQVVADAAQQRLEAVVVVLTVPGTIARRAQSIRRAPAARGSAATSAGSPTRAIAPSIARTDVAPRARS